MKIIHLNKLNNGNYLVQKLKREKPDIICITNIDINNDVNKKYIDEIKKISKIYLLNINTDTYYDTDVTHIYNTFVKTDNNIILSDEYFYYNNIPIDNDANIFVFLTKLEKDKTIELLNKYNYIIISIIGQKCYEIYNKGNKKKCYYSGSTDNGFLCIMLNDNKIIDEKFVNIYNFNEYSISQFCVDQDQYCIEYINNKIKNYLQTENTVNPLLEPYSLKISNLYSYGKSSVSFSDIIKNGNIIGVLAKNQYGKTSFYDIINFALSDIPFRGSKKNIPNICSYEDINLIFTFIKNGKKFSIIKNFDNIWYTTLKINNSVVNKPENEIVDYISSLFGYSPIELINYKYESFLELTTFKKKIFLLKMFNIKSVDDAHKICKNKCKEYEIELKILKNNFLSIMPEMEIENKKKILNNILIIKNTKTQIDILENKKKELYKNINTELCETDIKYNEPEFVPKCEYAEKPCIDEDEIINFLSKTNYNELEKYITLNNSITADNIKCDIDIKKLKCSKLLIEIFNNQEFTESDILILPNVEEIDFLLENAKNTIQNKTLLYNKINYALKIINLNKADEYESNMKKYKYYEKLLKDWKSYNKYEEYKNYLTSLNNYKSYKNYCYNDEIKKIDKKISSLKNELDKEKINIDINCDENELKLQILKNEENIKYNNELELKIEKIEQSLYLEKLVKNILNPNGKYISNMLYKFFNIFINKLNELLKILDFNFSIHASDKYETYIIENTDKISVNLVSGFQKFVIRLLSTITIREISDIYNFGIIAIDECFDVIDDMNMEKIKNIFKYISKNHSNLIVFISSHKQNIDEIYNNYITIKKNKLNKSQIVY